MQDFIARSARKLPDSAGPLPRGDFPYHNSWNDYGRNFFAQLHIRPAAGESLDLHMRLMFEVHMRSEHVFKDNRARTVSEVPYGLKWAAFAQFDPQLPDKL